MTTNSLSHAWSVLPDIEEVSDALDAEAQSLFAAIGAKLARVHQTSRFAMTLLHSHFSIAANELLLEEEASDGCIVTSVYSTAETKHLDLVPKSWLFPLQGREIEVLTWTTKQGVFVPPLAVGDGLLLQSLAKTFQLHPQAARRFGMALVGRRPDVGMVWSEATDTKERVLVQQQLPASEVDGRNPIRTMWICDEDGRFTITMGCCAPLTSNRGHSGIRHPRG